MRTALVVLLAGVFGLGIVGTASAYVVAPATIWTIGGDGFGCFPSSSSCGDGPNALLAQIGAPRGVVVDPAGNVYFTDFSQKLRRITPSGAISSLAGNGAGCSSGAPCGDGGPATSAQLGTPSGIARDTAGNIYIAEQNGNRIRRVTPGGAISTVVGNGAFCAATDPCGDGGPATAAQLSAPSGVAVGAGGVLYIADQFHHRIRRVVDGTITTIAGTGATCADTTTPCGDGGSATSAQLTFPFAVAVDSAGAVYTAGGEKVRKIEAGVITTIAGTGSACANSEADCGDGGNATAAQLKQPLGIAVDSVRRVYISDSGNHRVRMITPTGRIGTIAGTGTPCGTSPSCGDGGAGIHADLNNPHGVAVDPTGANLFIADLGDNLIRWLAGPQGGPAGTPGAPGPTGGTGSPGGQGVPGLRGTPGRDARVRCVVGRPRRGRVRVVCRVKLVRPTAAHAIRARLSRAGKTYATGIGRASAGRIRLSMQRTRRITRGTYTLTTRVAGRSGRSRQSVIVR